MRPITQFNPRDIKGILTDLDDTITIGRKFHWRVLEGMYRLKERGFRVILVTGRPAGWCDCLLRLLPIDGIVGENGALYFYKENEIVKHRFMLPEEELKENRKRLEKIRDIILSKVPEAKVAKDQFSRVNDLAIDFSEDIYPPLSIEKVKLIYSIFKENGANAKISSIHVNGWFGDFNKLITFLVMAKELWNESKEYVTEHYVYCGDSPNDAEMFKFFKNSVGMGNLKRFIKLLKEDELPAYITDREEGYGFLEVVERLVS